MEGNAYALASGTIINAIATGKGSTWNFKKVSSKTNTSSLTLGGVKYIPKES